MKYNVEIYKDYLFKKSIPEKMTDLYMKFFKKDMEIVKVFGIFIFFSCRISIQNFDINL